MALNEQIVEETRYYRQCVDKDNKKWERYGLWNRGKDTECEDGNTVETKVGAIKGITTSTNVSETGYAADAKTVSELNQSLTDKMTFYVLSSSTDTRDDYSVGFLIDNSLIGYMIFNMGWVHVRYEVDTTGVRTYIKYGSNEWWRFS